MPRPAHQTCFSLTIDGLERDVQVLAFSGEEAISKPYFFNMEWLANPGLDLESLVDAEAFLGFDPQGRGIHGRIYHIERSGDRYRAVLVPHLSYLRHRINRRVYQGFSVPKIVALILEEHGILGDAYRLELKATYPQRDYRTQYDETDLHFIQRLCEEEGIHFHFQHSAQGHVLVFADDRTVFPRIGQATALARENGWVAGEHIQVPGARTLERRYMVHRQVEGQSKQVYLHSGHVVECSDCPGQGNDLWLLTQVFHEGRQPEAWDDSVEPGDDVLQGYRNRFTALAWEVFHRPPVVHHKPQVSSSQVAVVIALEDEETPGEPRPGRVKVRFPWDREGRFDDKSSCWLVGAASECGQVKPLQVGEEVTVTFVDGDPDQPRIGGCQCCR